MSDAQPRHEPVVPEVGMGATVIMWSDRYAVTIVEVSPNGKSVKVQSDNYKRTDTNGMSENQSYEFSPNPDAPITTYTLRKNGRWVHQGSSMNGQGLAIGFRDAYHDFSF